VGRERPIFRLVGYLAARHQYGHDNRDVSDGFRDPKHAKQDTQALHLKLDELIRVNTTARNSLMGLEQKSELEVEEVKLTFVELTSTADAPVEKPRVG